MKPAPESVPLAKVALALASLALVLWSLVMQVDHTSPGPLSAVHVQATELSERGACKSCHGTSAHDMAAACAECHAPVAEQIASAAGFHGTLTGIDAEDCARCHGEHAGEEFMLVSARSFALAGFATREAYDHDELDFLLQGRHTELGCKDCHANADVVVLARGERRFGGLEQGCQSCHEDAHEGRIARACGECHGQEHPFALVASFQHDDFESECAHAAVSCAQCHTPGGAHDSELLAGFDPPDCARVCSDCHVSPHTEPFVAAAAVLANVPEGETCAACHSEGHGAFRGHPAASPPALHAASGFALEAPHNALACEACHLGIEGDVIGGDVIEGDVVGDGARFALHFPAREADDCQACHGDPHAGQFAARPLGEMGCLACHAREVFEPSTFGPAEHARSDFPLVASHEAVACARCHPSTGTGEPTQFEGTPGTCAGCHADAHRGAFDEFDNPEGCARCHQPTLFAEVERATFDHGGWAGFVLDGAHARAECEACHPRSAEADERARTFGFSAAVFGEPVERCATCHADVHDGRFDRPELPRELAGRSDCARCHTSESFSELALGPHEPFEHERWTGYPMADFHAEVECAECHVPTAAPDAHGRTFGRADKLCQDCHADPHVAQFAVEGATDCARCHLDAGGLAFDHQRDSRYALDEVHAPLECAACHVPWPLPGGGEAVRYKPLGTECADCHDPEFLERSRTAGPRRKPARGAFAPRGGGR
mgnify:CR=1 FL=1